MKTAQPTKSSRKVWLLLLLFILSTLPYLFAPLRNTLYWLCWHWQQSWNFFFLFFSHLRWESGLWFISHNLSQSDSLKNKEKKRKKKKKHKQFWCISIRREQAGEERPAHERTLLNFFSPHFTQIKSALSPRTKLQVTLKIPPKVTGKTLTTVSKMTAWGKCHQKKK